MALTQQNFTLAKAQDVNLKFKGTTTNNVTGYSMTFTIRRSAGVDAIVTKTTSSGIAVSGSTGTWIVTVVITDTDIIDIDTNINYLWSLWRDGADTTYPLAKGSVSFEDSAQIG